MTTPVFEPQALDEFLVKLWPRLHTSDGHQHISANSLKMFVRCPEQFRRRYVLGHKAPPSGATIWGGADHRAVAANYEQKIESERDLPVDDVAEIFVTEVEEGLAAVEDDVLWDGKDFDGKTQEQAVAIIKDRGSKLVAKYQADVAPQITPITVEQEFLLEHEALPVPVKGFVDLQAERRGNASLAGFPTFAPSPAFTLPFVVERKTKGQNRPPAPDERFQARVYELATGLPVEFQISIKSQAPQVKVYAPEALEPAKRTIEALRRTVLGIAHCYAVFGEEQPWPDYGRLHTFACSFCSFKSSCPWWEEAYWPR